METPTKNHPVIRHTTTAKDVQKLERVLRMFMKEMSGKSKKFSSDLLKDWDKGVDGENLLKYRKLLVESVKEGMLKRKDMEIEIAATAAIVWFNRLDVARREAILNEW